MAGKKQRIIIQKMISNANESVRYTPSMTYEEFVADNKMVVYSSFYLLQLGELIGQLDDSFRDANPQISWSQIKGLRNRIVHHYDGISFPLVWDILQNDVPKLIADLTALYDSLSEE